MRLGDIEKLLLLKLRLMEDGWSDRMIPFMVFKISLVCGFNLNARGQHAFGVTLRRALRRLVEKGLVESAGWLEAATPGKRAWSPVGLTDAGRDVVNALAAGGVEVAPGKAWQTVAVAADAVPGGEANPV